MVNTLAFPRCPLCPSTTRLPALPFFSVVLVDSLVFPRRVYPPSLPDSPLLGDERDTPSIRGRLLIRRSLALSRKSRIYLAFRFRNTRASIATRTSITVADGQLVANRSQPTPHSRPPIGAILLPRREGDDAFVDAVNYERASTHARTHAG